MKFLLLLTLAPLLWSRPVSLYFPSVTAYYGGYHALGDYYDNDNLGGDYGIRSVGGYRDPYILDGGLQFPLHGPGVLYVAPGFHNFLTFQYTGYMPYSPFASLVLRYQGNVVQQIQLPSTALGVYNTVTVTVNSVADEIWFGVLPNGQFAGSAGDLEYREIDLDLIDPQPDPPPASPLRALPTNNLIEGTTPTTVTVLPTPTIKSPTRVLHPRLVRPRSLTRSQTVR